MGDLNEIMTSQVIAVLQDMIDIQQGSIGQYIRIVLQSTTLQNSSVNRTSNYSSISTSVYNSIT